MTWSAAKRLRSEPIRLATLAVLFAATMLAAVMLPRQIRAALDAGSVPASGVSAAASGSTGSSWWTPPAARPVPDAHHRAARGIRKGCRSGCKATDQTNAAQ